jgi:PAS domain S-box-containing protein
MAIERIEVGSSRSIGKEHSSERELKAEIAALQLQLEEAQDALRAIREGEVDALVHQGRIFKLDSASNESDIFHGQVLAQINEAVVATDLEDRITFLNPAAAFQYGVRPSEVLGRNIHEMFTAEWLRPNDPQLVRKALEELGEWRGECVHIRKDGTAIQVESTMSCSRDSEGNTIGRLAVIRDVSQRARTQAALEESARQKDHFLATLAHELRNPLSPLMNGLYLLDVLKEEPQRLEETQAMMMRQLRHMVRLVDDLMDLSRISRGKLILKLEKTDLRDILKLAVEASQPLISEYGHSLIQHIPKRPVLVNGDPSRLMQVISNLLNNAAKYTPHNGRIDLYLGTADGNAIIRVEDNGIGIAREHLTRVFDMFAQVRQGVFDHKGGGLGIGLNIASKLVHMHKGEISAKSDGPGRGSNFLVSLPLLLKPERTGKVDGPAITGKTIAQRILVVDDNVDAATSLALLLRANGHEVKVAHNGSQALDIGEDFHPNTVLMDIGMPVMDGITACEHMRERPWGHDILIVAISGWGQEQDRKRSSKAGFDEHLVKPVDRGTLEGLLQRVRV